MKKYHVRTYERLMARSTYEQEVMRHDLAVASAPSQGLLVGVS
jgi:hypothetical protein